MTRVADHTLLTHTSKHCSVMGYTLCTMLLLTRSKATQCTCLVHWKLHYLDAQSISMSNQLQSLLNTHVRTTRLKNKLTVQCISFCVLSSRVCIQNMLCVSSVVWYSICQPYMKNLTGIFNRLILSSLYDILLLSRHSNHRAKHCKSI